MTPEQMRMKKMAMAAAYIMMLSTNQATNRVPSPAGWYATWMFSGVSNVIFALMALRV